MGAIPLSSVKGDVAVGRNVDIGGDVDIKGHIHAGHNLTVDGWLDAPNVKGPSKGLFPSETAMKGAYPLPEPGWWALVGDTLPADVWCVVDGEWTATGKKSGNLTVANLTLDARIDEVKKAVDLTTAALDALVSGDTSDAIDNYNEIIKFLEGFRDDETLAGTLKTLRDTAEEAHTRLSAGLSAALPRIVSIADIDTMGTDGSAEALRNFMRELIRTGPAHTRYALVNGNYIAGVLEIFSDNSLHCITQVLETHQSVEDGVLLPNGHDDGRIRRWWRTMNFAGNSQSGLTAGVWTPWRECEPEGLREDLTEHKTQYRDLVHRVEGIISRANRIMDFNGFVTRVEDVPTNDANAVYWVTSVGGFRSGLAPDDPTLRELSDYNNEAGEGRYDRLFRCDNELYMVSDDKLVGYCNDDDLEYLRMALEQRLDTTDKAVDTISKNLASKPWRGDLNVLPFDGTVDSEFTLTQNGAEWEGKTVYVSLAHGFATVAPYWNVSSGTAQPAGYRVGYLPEYTEGSTVLDRRPRADRVYVCDGMVYVPSGNTIAPVCTAASLTSAVSQLRASIEKNRQTISSVQTEMYGLLDECPWRGDLGVYPLAGTVFNAQASTDSMEAWRLYYDANDHRVAMLDDETGEVTYPEGPNTVMHGIAAGNQEALFIIVGGGICRITGAGLVFLVDEDEIKSVRTEITGVKESLTEHKAQYRDLVHRVEGIISRADRIMDFDGIVARVEEVPTNNANAVYWVTSVGGFRSGLAPDDPTLRELSDYNLDDVHGEGRNDRLFRLGNDLYMVNDESADNLVRYCHDILRGELERNIDGVAGRVEELETGHVPSNQYYALCESLFGRDFTLVANEKVRGLWAYDRNTRRYSFDRLTNITRPQMDAALLAAPLMFRAAHQAGDFALPGLRFCVIPYGTTLAAGMFADSEVEEAVFPGTFNNYPSISGTPNLFDGAAKLRYVVGYLNVRWAAEGSMQTFRGCSALEEIRIFKLTQNISFSDSPNLSMESLQYLVDNASNASSIFVGLHADCYARLTEEVRAAANEKGISFGIV